MGFEACRTALATYFDTQFEDISAQAVAHFKEPHSSDVAYPASHAVSPSGSSPALVQAKSIALVENAHLVSALTGVLTLQASQNILNFSSDGELNVMVVREVRAPHSQKWTFTISSNFNLFNSKHPPVRIKVQARYDRQLDQLLELSIDKDEFDLEAYRSVLEQYTQYHRALNPAKAASAQDL